MVKSPDEYVVTLSRFLKQIQEKDFMAFVCVFQIKERNPKVLNWRQASSENSVREGCNSYWKQIPVVPGWTCYPTVYHES